MAIVRDTNLSSSDHASPQVSIGIPVFNGENYLEPAIQSVLGQTFHDFELIIFDNASTDSTEAICRKHADSDARIQYHRNKANIGAAANYDSCFNHAAGTYFKWLSHDDTIEPEHLKKTVDALSANPRANKCVTAVQEIDHDNNINRSYEHKGLKGSQDQAFKRFSSLMKHHHNGFEFFALFRRKSVLGSQLHGNYVGPDRVFIAEMALRGQRHGFQRHLRIAATTTINHSK